MSTGFFETAAIVTAPPSAKDLAFGPESILGAVLGENMLDLKELRRRYSSLLIQLDLLHPALIRAEHRALVASKEWGVNEILGHLIDADRDIWWPRIEAILSGGPAEFENVDQNALVTAHGWKELQTEEILSQLMRIRWNYAMNLNKLDDESFDRKGHHFLLGDISIRDIISILIKHDAHYLDKIRILAEDSTREYLN